MNSPLVDFEEKFTSHFPKMTRRQLARLTSIPRARLVKLLNGSAQPTSEELVSLLAIAESTMSATLAIRNETKNWGVHRV